MSPATLTRGASVGTAFVDQLRARLLQMRNDLMEHAATALEDSLQAGEDAAHLKIEMSTTPTGERRAAEEGGHPGRIDTGDFYDEFQHDSYQIDPNHMQGRQGWISEDGASQAHSAGGKSYFELQDQGTVDVSAVHALLDASEVAKTEFKKRLTDYVRQEFS